MWINTKVGFVSFLYSLTGKYKFFFGLIIVQLTSCIAPDPASQLSPQQLQVFVTNHDPAVNFSNFKTYTIDDSINLLSRGFNDTLKIQNATTNLIINSINQNLQKDGFVQVASNQNPDLDIIVSTFAFAENNTVAPFAFINTPTTISGYPSPAALGFPGFQYAVPLSFNYFNIIVGTVSIDMIDLKTPTANPANKQLPIIWNAFLIGPIFSSTQPDSTNISFAINSAFNQSPYLKAGP